MQDIQNGCYDICTNCFADGNCCSSFDTINAPVLNKDELMQLIEVLKKDDFYDAVDDNLYKIRTNNNECIFLKNGRCSIYNFRPLDCKLYPFDIIKKDSKYYLVLYQLDCIEGYTIVDNFDCLDELIEKIKTWIVDYTDDRNYTKMRKLKYKVIKEV
ncbi:MAG: YkgJ family cysteine cluster protein [Firmicutes bacterium]|nr:YkgJ family cysteine cluster protein [Bacillota bacterium]